MKDYVNLILYFLIMKKNWFQEFKDMVDTENYHTAVKSLGPDLKRIYAPHLNKICAFLYKCKNFRRKVP